MPTTDTRSIWQTPAGGSLMAAMLGLRPVSSADRETLAQLKAAPATASDAEFKEGDHPRGENGQFGSGGGASSSPYHDGAKAIRNMDPDDRDNTYPADLPGGWQAHNLYEAQKLMPKGSDKFKRLTDSNSFTLHQDYHALAHVDGHLFGLSKYEDPDAESDDEDRNGDPKEYCWHFVRLDHPNEKGVETHTRDPEEAIKAMREYKPPAEVFVPGRKKPIAQDAGWIEDDHERAKNGQFGTGSGGASGGVKPPVKPQTAQVSVKASAAREFVPAALYDEAQRTIALYSKQETPAAPLSDADKATATEQLAQHLAAAHAAKPAYDEKLKAIGEKLGADVKLAGIKGGDRLLEKHVRENGSNPAEMKDLVRGSLVVKSLDDVGPALEALSKDFKIARVKDRFAAPLSTGYSDMLINVELTGGILGEVQIHVPEMLAAKGELGHALYDIERKLPPGSALKEQLVEMQSRVYGAASAAARQRATSKRLPPENSQS